MSKPPLKRGEENGNSKLSEAQVVEMQALWATKQHSREELAKRYGISRQTVMGVLSGRLWRYLFKGKSGHSLRYGEGHAGHKLTAAQVSEIRRRLLAGEKGVRLAEDFGVAVSVISEIKTGKAWRR